MEATEGLGFEGLGAHSEGQAEAPKGPSPSTTWTKVQGLGD